MTKPDTLAESIMEGLQDALGYTKALADYIETIPEWATLYKTVRESRSYLAKDAFNAGWNAALGSVYDKQDIQTAVGRANEPRIKVDVETL